VHGKRNERKSKEHKRKGKTVWEKERMKRERMGFGGAGGEDRG
jgi:hypothetical protein